MFDDGKEKIYGIVGLCVGLCSQLTVCERVEEFSVCCQPHGVVMRRPSKSLARVSLGTCLCRMLGLSYPHSVLCR